jgi:hypothetical protein
MGKPAEAKVYGDRPLHSVEAKLTLREGEEGIDADPSNPLARATHRLLNEGQPLKRIHVSFFNPGSGLGLRWVGAFVWSAGERLVFFPGFVAPIDVVSLASSSEPTPVDRGFNVDHITLEKDLRTWHITTQGMNRKRLGGYMTQNLGAGRAFWCGMHVRSPECLRLLKRDTVVTTQVPPSDKTRRGKILQAAFEEAPHSCATIDEKTRITQPNFIYIGLIVGPADFEHVFEQPKLILGLPRDLPFVQSRKSRPEEQFGLSLGRAKLNAPLEIDIVTALVPGTMTVPMAFTSPARIVQL